MNLVCDRLIANDPSKERRIALPTFSKAFCRVSMPVVKKEKWAVQTLSQYSQPYILTSKSQNQIEIQLQFFL